MAYVVLDGKNAGASGTRVGRFYGANGNYTPLASRDKVGRAVLQAANQPGKGYGPLSVRNVTSPVEYLNRGKLTLSYSTGRYEVMNPNRFALNQRTGAMLAQWRSGLTPPVAARRAALMGALRATSTLARAGSILAGIGIMAWAVSQINRPLGKQATTLLQGTYPSAPNSNVWYSGQPGTPTKKNLLLSGLPATNTTITVSKPTFVKPDNAFVGFYDWPINGVGGTFPLTRSIDARDGLFPFVGPLPDIEGEPMTSPKTNRGLYTKAAAIDDADAITQRFRSDARPLDNIAFQWNGASGVATVVPNAPPKRPPPWVRETKVRMNPVAAVAIRQATEALDLLQAIYIAVGGQSSVNIKGRIKSKGGAGKVGPGQISFLEKLDFISSHMDNFDPEKFWKEIARQNIEDRNIAELGKRGHRHDPIRNSRPGSNPFGVELGPAL